MAGDEGVSVLILGGCGFVGRHLVSHLVEGKLARKITVVDKVPPAMAWLNSRHRAAFEDESVTFRSGDLLNEATRLAVFEEAGPVDYVINLAAQTKANQPVEVCERGTVPLSTGCASAAAASGVKRFIELSDGRIFSSSQAAKEDDDSNPRTVMAKCKLTVEKELASVVGLDYVILRPATIYGTADRTGLVPWLILGAIYEKLGEPLRLLGDESVPCSTVHVSDVVRAVWFACTEPQSVVASGCILHLADDGDTTLGGLAQLTGQLFGIQSHFVGKTLSAIAKMDMQSLCDDVNDKHLEPWAHLCRDSGIENTPLTAYASADSLACYPLRLNSSRIRDLGFTFCVGRPTRELLREILLDYQDCKLFP